MSMNSVQMEPEAEQPNRTFYQGTNALYFIHIQLFELTRDCDMTLQNGLVSINFFFKLQNKLEKILYETRAACNPPLRKPAMVDFEILRCVGRGTFGTVDLMDHRQTGQAFAVKTIRCEKATRKFQARALMERDILTFCDNPFIVSMFCSFETETDLHIVMEYVGGGNCVTLLERYGRLPATVARLYAAEVILAVEYIHSYGILHRDLKPSNLLISSSGHIKLADFGLSKICPLTMKTEPKEDYVWRADQEFVDSEMVGTLLYMAPEVIQYMTYGKPVDWWGLGIILYEFLVGRVPFVRKPGQKIFELVNNEEVTWPEGSEALQTDVRDVISLLLQRESVKRLGTGGAGEVKGHSFFQGLDWSDLHNTDVPLIEEEWNTTQSSESCSEESSSDSSPSSNESCDGDSTEDGTSNEGSSYESSSDDEDLLPDEVVDFCSVAFCFKEVYGSPKQLSLCDVLSASAQPNYVVEDQKEEQEQKSQHEVHESIGGLQPEDLQDETFKEVLESILDPVAEPPDGGLVPPLSVLSFNKLVDSGDSEAPDGGEEITSSEESHVLSADSDDIVSETRLTTAQSSEPHDVEISSYREESSEDSSCFVSADDGLPEEIMGSDSGAIASIEDCRRKPEGNPCKHEENHGNPPQKGPGSELDLKSEPSCCGESTTSVQTSLDWAPAPTRKPPHALEATGSTGED